MGKTRISWATDVWNPIVGCSRVSEGCRNCYAERIAARFYPDLVRPARLADQTEGHRDVRIGPRWTGVIRFMPEALDLPLHWRRPRRIFVDSMGDLFHPAVRLEWIDRILDVIAASPRHTYLALTKRPELIRARLGNHLTMNFWLGASVEDQATADKRLPHLVSLAADGWSTFVSVEPLLGAADLRAYLPQVVDTDDGGNDLVSFGPAWIIVGGESGPGARPCEIAWIRALVAQCRAAGVPCYVKQLGRRPVIEAAIGTGPDVQHAIDAEWPAGTRFGNPDRTPGLNGRVALLCDPKGADPEEWPKDLRVREMP